MNKFTLRSPTWLGFLAIFLWSTTVAFTRSISVSLGPFTSGAFIYLLAGSFLYLFQILKTRKFKFIPRSNRLYVFGCGSLFVLYTTSLYVGLSLATNDNQTLQVGLINYLWPSLTLLFSIPILKKKPGWGLIPGTLIALTGVFLSLTQNSSFSWSAFTANLLKSPLPYLFGLSAAICWALYSNLSRKWNGAGSDGAVPLFSMVTGICFLILGRFFPESNSLNIKLIIEILFFSTATALAYLSWDFAMRKGNIILVVAGSYLIPFFSTVVSCIYLQISPAPIIWIGCLCIILGSLLSWRSMT